MAITLSPDAEQILSALTQKLNISESALVERCIRHLHKRMEALDRYRKDHPNSGWGHTSEYYIWNGMMRRCFNPECAAFPNYGGRGITVAPELQTFQGFLHVIGKRPEGKSLERIDNNGNYDPRNLRWSTAMEQNSNKRTNDLITYKGKTQTLTAWARELGMSQTALWTRLYRHKWSMKDALTRPATRITNRKLTDAEIIEISKSSHLQSVLASRFGVSQSQISRIRMGQRWRKLTGLAP
jgi:hypothetical protein